MSRHRRPAAQIAKISCSPINPRTNSLVPTEPRCHGSLPLPWLPPSTPTYRSHRPGYLPAAVSPDHFLLLSLHPRSDPAVWSSNHLGRISQLRCSRLSPPWLGN